MNHGNVTVISSLPPIVGLSPYTKAFVTELSKRISVTFLGFKHIYPAFLYPGKIYDESAEILSEHPHLRIRNVLNWYNPFGWLVEAFRIKTDIIHAQWWSFPLAPVYITILGINKLRGKKIVLTIHNVLPHEKSFLKIFLNKSVYFLGDEFIVHTKQNKEDLAKIIKTKKIHVIPHGLVHTPLKGMSKEQAREGLKICETDKVLLCFGHIRDYKGLDVAIRALSLIKDPSVKLIIAGRCWEDWSKYEQLIEQLDLKERVILKVGFIPTDQIEPVFRASDLVLLPYKHFNSQSGVGALVLPFEIPLIVARTGGLPEYVKREDCVIEPNHHEELAAKIQNILLNKELYEQLKKDILTQKAELSWEAIAEKTVTVYGEGRHS